MTSDQAAVKEEHTAFAQVGSRYYPAFVAVFTALVIISNVTATKGVAFGPIITDGGFIVFPLTYVIGDVLSEVYGFKAARRAIYLGFAMNILAALSVLGDDLSARRRLLHERGAFENIVHAYTQLIIAGLAGFIVGQTINAWVVVAIKERTKEKHLWARLVGLDVRRSARRHPGVLQHRRQCDRHQHLPRFRRLHGPGMGVQDRSRGGHAADHLPGDRLHQAPRADLRGGSLSNR